MCIRDRFRFADDIAVLAKRECDSMKNLFIMEGEWIENRNDGNRRRYNQNQYSTRNVDLR